MSVHWFLPTTGDGHEIRSAITTTDHRTDATRPGTIRYLGQVARAAEDSGFGALLTPVGAGCPDPWIVCSALSQQTSRINLLIAFRTGYALPTLLAQQAQAFQEVSGGRLRLNVVTGGDPVEQRAYGDFLDHDARYERTAEYLEILNRCWEGKPFDHTGTHYRIEGGGLAQPLADRPKIYFGGSSPAAHRVAARSADVALTWAEPPQTVAERLAPLRAL
ncbi:LLM class flavin-dependent oxidoreductase, partial [Actinocorallia lasiicapitis]